MSNLTDSDKTVYTTLTVLPRVSYTLRDFTFFRVRWRFAGSKLLGKLRYVVPVAQNIILNLNGN